MNLNRFVKYPEYHQSLFTNDEIRVRTYSVYLLQTCGIPNVATESFRQKFYYNPSMIPSRRINNWGRQFRQMHRTYPDFACLCIPLSSSNRSNYQSIFHFNRECLEITARLGHYWVSNSRQLLPTIRFRAVDLRIIVVQSSDVHRYVLSEINHRYVYSRIVSDRNIDRNHAERSRSRQL